MIMKTRVLLAIIYCLCTVTAILSIKLSSTTYLLQTEQASCASEMFDFATLDADSSLALYQLMKDFDEVMAKHSVEYWAEGGTILGALRHKGIIPYDDDLDVHINAQDIPRLEPVIYDMKRLGYEVRDSDNFPDIKFPSSIKNDWLHISSTNKCTNRKNILDVFAVNFKGDKSTYVNNSLQRMFGRRTFNKSEVFPLKRYQFGEITISGPRDPLPYLKEYFSEDVLTKGCIYPQHQNPAIKRLRCFTLQSEMLQPLKPTGPLLDRLNELTEQK